MTKSRYGRYAKLVEGMFSRSQKRAASLTEELPRGLRGGICNRSSCTTHAPALWFNRSTRKYYCFHCAAAINAFCAPGEEGTPPLCELDDSESSLL